MIFLMAYRILTVRLNWVNCRELD